MQENERKKIVFSGIQPTGNLHLGNYIGALRNFGPLQEEYDCLYSIVDLHAITVRQNPTQLRQNCLKLMSLYLAAGLDPDKSLIYFQSHVPAHAELAWVLNCFTYMGELSRMTQFKDKAQKHAENINVGLFAYPTLMAADILLYQTNFVPVGNDQKQHIEITRDIAECFNAIYGDVFTIPEPLIGKVGARIMSLSDPTRKMSKSDPEDTFIAILDEPNVIRKKVRRAVTDSEALVKYDVENKPGVSNLMSIYSAVTGKGFAEIENEFVGKGYGDFKEAVADAVIAELEPIQARYRQISADKAYLNEVMTKGAERAAKLAARTMSKVRRKAGLAATQL